jgi:ankyrin repeat protein
MKPNRIRLSVTAAILAVSAAANAAYADSPLADAIRNGNRRAAVELINSGADVNATQPDGTTALHWAAYKVDNELALSLLAKGAKANVRNNFGATPLGEAVKVANVELVKALLKAGADPNAANEDGQTALMLAAKVGATDVAEALIRAGANVNAQEQFRGQTALMWAAAQDEPDVVELLLEHGASTQVRMRVNDWGNQITSEPRAQYRPTGGLTPLLYAARSGCERCVLAMLKAGADIDWPNPDGVTPLMSAIDNMNFDVAKLLLEKGANPHLRDWHGRSALYIAVDVRAVARLGFGFEGRGGGAAAERLGRNKTSSMEVIRLLLEAGVDRNPQLNMHRPGRGGNSGRFIQDLLTAGCTPLLRAANAADNEAIQVLLDAGALVDLPNVMGVTPFMAAAGVGFQIRDPSGKPTPADVEERLRAMETLRLAGADVNARITDTSSHTARIARPSSMTNRQGQTALYGAINWGWTNVVKYLLDHGARVDIADASGKTPLDAVKGNAGGRDHVNVPEITAMIQNAIAAGKTAGGP